MDSSEIFSFRYLRLALIGILVAGGAWGGSLLFGQAEARDVVLVQTPSIPALSPDDVSLLFPAPTREEDFAKLIAVRDLTTQDPDPSKRDVVWTNAVFKQFIAIANSAQGQVDGTTSRIGLPVEVQSIDSWFIAGIRIDAGAPGLSSDIRGQFGQSPEIRLIVQPVTRNADGTPHVHDIAGHLIFDFLTGLDTPAQADCLQRPKPDLDKFKAIVTDLVALKMKLSNGELGADKVLTDGLPLGVHPGLADAATAANLRQEIKLFLERHISNLRLNAMAIAGIPDGAPEPWIFLSMRNISGTVAAVHGPTLDGQQFAELLEPRGASFQVIPQPHTNNLNPTTCKNAVVSATSLPIGSRAGDATADVFVNPPLQSDRTKAILAVIADPVKSHFFNTDCVSCHTETRLMTKLPNFKNIPGIDTAVLPKDSWNVRNFGWSPAGGLQATVTRRTAAETAAVVTYINSEMSPSQQH
jgi:mono/diheme cytochrome c family protein